MNAQEISGRCESAAEDFARHEHRKDGLQIIEDICGGLTLLRDAMFARMHADVERRIGLDSMVAPISEEKVGRAAKTEIEIFQVAVAAAVAGEKGYIADASWFREWLMQLRLGAIAPESQAAKRLASYAVKSCSEQRMAFGNVIAATLPEANRAPLVMMRLVSPAVRIATALAFGRSADALVWRHEQIEHLPSISDCYHCHGKLMENGEQCSMCGNPLWTFEWLTTSDG